ncbi:hypothetical protein JB92DRAFT_3109991 [Gautieria morchelliformis]|nr:hypothetical protein JB92DRAFT_3109991 [Gautieria morchelliformis]
MAFAQQVEELVLLKCSLLSDEALEFVLSRHEDVEAWTQTINAHSEGETLPLHVSCPARFTVKIRDIPIWFEIYFPAEYPLETTEFEITVRGYNISRTEQQRWQDIIQKRRAQLSEANFPAYELISLHLLPCLHEEYDGRIAPEGMDAMNRTALEPGVAPEFHALLTSHHLKSPHKRRSLQQWSSELCLAGFAKVGHPGLIYCSGLESDVKEFVTKVKDMQWLALRVRFVEALPDAIISETERRGTWLEVEKVGEVVDEMRKLGRENYVLALGIGSGGAR